VTSEEDWVQAIAPVQERWGGLQILVASAGVVIARPVEEMELEEWRRVMAVNLDGVFLGVKHGIPAMRSGSGGSIILVSSAAGIKLYPEASACGASKCAALECAQRGDKIRVNTVHPSGVVTPIWRGVRRNRSSGWPSRKRSPPRFSFWPLMKPLT
jgi:NAD(P)-dependent dehydrogenase (short-subunit alcohol dehydrogenase family)